MVCYHVTLMDNLNSIMEKGLIPTIGERSEDCGENEELIYLFPTLDDMETALGSWLGEWYNGNYGEDIVLASLEINLPDDFPIYLGEVEYEVVSRKVIEPKFIKFFKEE